MREEDSVKRSDGSPSRIGSADSAEEPTREEERGEASEPDAPRGGEENPGMSTILDGSPGTGVQDDVADE